MQKLSQTEELARSLAAKARRHTLTPEQISRAMALFLHVSSSPISYAFMLACGA